MKNPPEGELEEHRAEQQRQKEEELLQTKKRSAAGSQMGLMPGMMLSVGTEKLSSAEEKAPSSAPPGTYDDPDFVPPECALSNLFRFGVHLGGAETNVPHLRRHDSHKCPCATVGLYVISAVWGQGDGDVREQATCGSRETWSRESRRAMWEQGGSDVWEEREPATCGRGKQSRAGDVWEQGDVVEGGGECGDNIGDERAETGDGKFFCPPFT